MDALPDARLFVTAPEADLVEPVLRFIDEAARELLRHGVAGAGVVVFFVCRVPTVCAVRLTLPPFFAPPRETSRPQDSVLASPNLFFCVLATDNDDVSDDG